MTPQLRDGCGAGLDWCDGTLCRECGAMPDAATAKVNVYSIGLCYLSVCAPANMSEDEVVEAVNALHPTGLDHAWRKADEPFRTGESNPFDAGGCGRHWLLVC